MENERMRSSFVLVAVAADYESVDNRRGLLLFVAI